MYTNNQIVAWAEMALAKGAKYWYGTCWYEASESLLTRKAKQYPGHYTSRRMSTYRKHIAEGRMVCDCVGLIKGFFWTSNGTTSNKYEANNCPDRSADGMFSLCDETWSIKDMPDEPGLVVWLKGHIGIYVGNGEVIEARGYKYGVVRTKLSARPWKKAGRLPESMLLYGQNGSQEATGSSETARVTLRKGMEGAEVKALQEALKAAGYDLPKYGADGDFGAETEAAVKAFQFDHKLVVDGIVGPKTQTALEAAQEAVNAPVIARPTVRKGNRGSAVETLQKLLMVAGYDLPKYGADGDFGSETLAAVKAFQKARGLEVDGIVGPKTWAALGA